MKVNNEKNSNLIMDKICRWNWRKLTAASKQKSKWKNPIVIHEKRKTLSAFSKPSIEILLILRLNWTEFEKFWKESSKICGWKLKVCRNFEKKLTSQNSFCSIVGWNLFETGRNPKKFFEIQTMFLLFLSACSIFIGKKGNWTSSHTLQFKFFNPY